MELGDFEWIKVMSSEQSSYLNKQTTICDFIVVDDNLFYLLSYLGEDQETANLYSSNFLIIYIFKTR